MTGPLPPVLICPGPDELPAASRVLGAQGWQVRIGFALPEEPWDLGPRKWACQGMVAEVDQAQAATWALVRGCALIVTAEGAPVDFLDDLRRAGRVKTYPEADPAQLSQDPVEAALLDLLANGHSLQQAAEALFLSRRTAQRRLNSVRAALGVRTTREAVVAWTRLQRDRAPEG